jgi:hypothetical protein
MEFNQQNKPCKACGNPTFHGWVENPVYGKEPNLEGMVELYIHVCPVCNTIENEIIKIDVWRN